jgi:hypothetical protein
MLRPFKFLEHGSDVVVIAARWQPQRARLHLKPSSWLRLSRMSQAETEQMVHNYLEWFAAAPNLLIEKDSDVIVNGERRSHIVMLDWKAS